jgi:hypothetical protein
MEMLGVVLGTQEEALEGTTVLVPRAEVDVDVDVVEDNLQEVKEPLPHEEEAQEGELAIQAIAQLRLPILMKVYMEERV